MTVDYEVLDTEEPIISTSIGSMKWGSYIVVGKDKNNKTDSSGNTRIPYQTNGRCYEAGSIDMFVGLNKLNSAKPEEGSVQNQSGRTEKKKVNSDFSKDAARIYISERSNPDEYFNINASPKSPSYADLSTVCLLADSVRIVARNNVKIVTHATGTKNSKLDTAFAAGGIHLIAGNAADNLQPLVKGDNLIEYFKAKDLEYHGALQAIREFFSSEIFNLWSFVNSHNHQVTTPVGPGQTISAPFSLSSQSGFATMPAELAKKIEGILYTEQNEGSLSKKYLSSSGGASYILSEKNMVN